MHELAFADSARPARSLVLRLPLKPYSLGHEIILTRQRNPLLFSGFQQLPPEAQRLAVIRAALVCSEDWAGNQRRQRWLWLWGRLIRRANFELAIADWLTYRREGSQAPNPPDEEVDQIKNGGGKTPRRIMGGPFLARLYAFIARLPAGEIAAHGSSAWDFPLGLAQFLYLCDLEARGEMRLENEEERQTRCEVDEIYHAVKTEREDQCPA